MRFFSRKSGFVSLKQQPADTPSSAHVAPAKISNRVDVRNIITTEGDMNLSKRGIPTILRCTSNKSSSSDFLTSHRKNESTDTGSTASATSTNASTDDEARVRPVLITVDRNPKRPVAKPAKQTLAIPVVEQYSPDILGGKQTEKFDSPIRRHLLRFMNNNNNNSDNNSIVDESDSTAFGDSTGFGESTIGDSTTFGESFVGTLSGSTIDGSVFTMDNIHEGSELDSSTVDGGATYSSDDLPSTTTSESASIQRRVNRNQSQLKLPKGTPIFLQDFVLVVQDLVEDFSKCGTYVLRSSEDILCGDEDELKEEAWREAKNRGARRGRSRRR